MAWIKVLPGVLFTLGLGLLIASRPCKPLLLSEVCGAPTKGATYLVLALTVLATWVMRRVDARGRARRPSLGLLPQMNRRPAGKGEGGGG